MRCSHGFCNSDIRYSDKPYMDGVTFHSFPNAKKEPVRRAKWVWACNTTDFRANSLKKAYYVCSKHFVDPGGPSKDHPDPVLATAEGGSCRTRRKLRDPSGREPFCLKTVMSSMSPSTDNFHEFTDESLKQYLKEHKGTRVVLVSKNNRSAKSPYVQWEIEESFQEEVPSSAQNGSSTLYYDGNVINLPLETKPINTLPVDKNNSTGTIGTPFVPTVVPKTAKTTMVQQHKHNLSSSSPGLVPTQDREVLVTPLNIYNNIVLSKVPCGWTPYYAQDQDELLFVKIQSFNVVMSLKINFLLNFSINVLGEELVRSHPLFTSLALNNIEVISLADIFGILDLLNRWKICLGSGSCEEFLSHSKNLKDCRQVWQTSSFHSTMCALLVPLDAERGCKNCRFLKYRLKAAAKRKSLCLSRGNCHATLKYLPLEEIQKRFKRNRDKLISSKRIIARLRKKIQKRYEHEDEDVIVSDDSESLDDCEAFGDRGALDDDEPCDDRKLLDDHEPSEELHEPSEELVELIIIEQPEAT